MIANACCNTCLLDKRLNALPPDAAPEAVAEYRRRVREIVENHPELSSPEKDYAINCAYESVLGPLQDYGPVKRHFNALMMALESLMTEGVRTAENPLRRAVQYAMVGNYIDFAVMGSVDEQRLRRLIADAGSIPIDADMLEALRREILRARRLVYIADNCGEIVMDRVLMTALHGLNPSLSVTAVVKGAPIVNDATREDAEQIGLLKVAQAVVDTGCGIAGCPEGRLSAECLGVLDGADVLIAKGQANYETLCGCGRNIFYIFMCKCQLFMDRFNVPQFSGIITRET